MKKHALRILKLITVFALVVMLPLQSFAAAGEGNSLPEGDNDILLTTMEATSSGTAKSSSSTQRVVVSISSAHAAEDGVSSFQFSLDVGKDTDATFTFDSAITDNATVAEYRYHSDTGLLNVYVAGVQTLFTANDPLKVGYVSLSSKDAAVSAVEDSLNYVYGNLLKNAGNDEAEFGIDSHTHVYDETSGKAWSWYWTDATHCAVTAYCTKCDYSETFTCKVEEETTPADCKNTGKTVYVAKVSLPTEEGEKTWTNQCPKQYDVTIPVTAHTAAKVDAVAATCTSTGLTEGEKCSVCGEILKEQEEIPALGHNWDEGKVTTEATDTEEGVLTYTCQNGCGETYTEVIKAKGHKYEVTDQKDATCTEEGYIVYTCTTCNHTYTSQIPTIDHNYKLVVTEPTCTEEGYTTHTCTMCGDSYTDTHTEKIAHTPGDAVEENRAEATCTTAGSYDSVIYCTVCNEELSRRAMTISVIDHTPETVPAVEATCTSTGLTEGEKCSVCGEILKDQDEIPALGHNWDEGKVATEATDTEEGVLTYTCKNGCGETYTEVIQAKGHKYEVTDQKDATCTEEGYIVYTCTTCNHTYTTQIPTIEHDYKATVTEPTCTAEGYTTHTCTMCGDSYTDTHTEKIAHTPGDAVEENKVLATCMIAGSYDSVVYCTVCGSEISRQTLEIPVTDHTAETVPAVAATCTEKGLTEGEKCSVCGEILKEQEEVAALGHKWDNGEVTKEATDTEEGVLTYTCQNGCGETYTELIQAKGHKYEVTDQKDATCTEKGYIVYTCTTCDDTYTTELPVIAHDYKAGEVVAPTCVEKGYTVYTCTMCGDSYKDDYTDEVAHTAGKAVKKNEVAATCTAAGSYDSVVYCDVCGEELSRETVEIPMLDHTAEKIPAVAATCTEKGLTEGEKCSVCSTILKAQDEVPALGHDWDKGTVTKEATDTEEGAITYTCKNGCGETYTEVIKAKGHQYEITDQKDATCTEKGYIVYTCTTCDDTYTTEIPTIPHDYQTKVVAPTCTEEGYTIHTCTMCGDSYQDAYADKIAHTAGEAVKENEIAATCTKAGSYDSVLYCTVCGTEISRTAMDIPMIDHTVEKIPAVEATCTEKGLTEGEKCSVCGTILKAQDEVPALGHNWDKGTVTKEATDTEEGVRTYTCQNGCGKTYTEVIKAKGHKYEIAAQKAATCTEEGYIVYSCTTSDDTYVTKVPATGHKYKQTKKVKATCTTEGYTVRTCTVCGDSYTASYTDKTAHNAGKAVKKNQTAATCTTAGSYDSVTYCTVCGTEISRKTQSTSKTGHTAVTVSGVAATCTQKGLTEGSRCSVCGTTLKAQSEIPALGHNWDEGVVTQEATSTEEGVRTYTCQNGCGATYTEVIQVESHEYEVTDQKDATCTEKGYVVYTCTTCDDTYTDELPTIDHNYQVTEVVEPTETEGGYTVHTCTMCGDSYNDSYTDKLGTDETAETADNAEKAGAGLTMAQIVPAVVVGGAGVGAVALFFLKKFPGKKPPVKKK